MAAAKQKAHLRSRSAGPSQLPPIRNHEPTDPRTTRREGPRPLAQVLGTRTLLEEERRDRPDAAAEPRTALDPFVPEPVFGKRDARRSERR